MNSREQAHAEDHKALRSLERRPWLIIAVAIVAIVAVSGLVYSIVNAHSDEQTREYAQQVRTLTAKAQAAADAAQGFAQADCGTWHDLTLIPPSSTSTESGLKLYAGFRNSYYKKGCVTITGSVPPADPRLDPYLDPGVS